MQFSFFSLAANDRYLECTFVTFIFPFYYAHVSSLVWYLLTCAGELFLVFFFFFFGVILTFLGWRWSWCNCQVQNMGVSNALGLAKSTVCKRYRVLWGASFVFRYWFRVLWTYFLFFIFIFFYFSGSTVLMAIHVPLIVEKHSTKIITYIYIYQCLFVGVVFNAHHIVDD